MTTLPWLIVPGFLVPSLIFVHVVIFYRLLVRTEIATAALDAGATSQTEARDVSRALRLLDYGRGG
jgi:hypothetical protein